MIVEKGYLWSSPHGDTIEFSDDRVSIYHQARQLNGTRNDECAHLFLTLTQQYDYLDRNGRPTARPFVRDIEPIDLTCNYQLMPQDRRWKLILTPDPLLYLGASNTVYYSS